MASSCPDPFIKESLFPNTGGCEYIIPDQRKIPQNTIRRDPILTPKQPFPVDGVKILKAFPAAFPVPLVIGDGKMLLVCQKLGEGFRQLANDF